MHARAKIAKTHRRNRSDGKTSTKQKEKRNNKHKQTTGREREKKGKEKEREREREKRKRGERKHGDLSASFVLFPGHLSLLNVQSNMSIMLIRRSSNIGEHRLLLLLIADSPQFRAVCRESCSVEMLLRRVQIAAITTQTNATVDGKSEHDRSATGSNKNDHE